jgi:hypothetical protein
MRGNDDALEKLQAKMDAMYGWAIPEPILPFDKDRIENQEEEEDIEDEVEPEDMAEKEDAVQVVEFQYQYQKPVNPKNERKQFMSSKAFTIFESPTDKSPRGLSKDSEDAEDDKHDIEIMNMMQASQLVKQYTASELTGRDRLRYMKSQIRELSGFEPKVKTSLPMHLGLKKKAHERVEKKVRDAKNIGIYTPILEKEFIRNEKTLKSSLNQKKEKLDVGIVGSVGKYSSKLGVMTVSKSMIQQIEKQGKKKGGKTRAVSMRGTGLGGNGNKKHKK